MDLNVLRAELDSNPGLYGAMSDVEVERELNAVDKQETRQYVSGSEIYNAVNDAEYAGLSDAQKDVLRSMASIDQIDTSSGVAKADIQFALAGQATSIANLQALKTTLVSRASQLGLGRVRIGDVTNARAL